MAILNLGGENNSDSALKPLPSLKDDTSSVPRMLTPSEIAWLRQNKKAVLERLFVLAKPRHAPDRQAA